MTTKNLLKKFRLAESLFDLHEDDFKVKNFRNWAYQIEQKEGQNLAEMSTAELSKLGFSASLIKRIEACLQTETFPELDEVLDKTPEGIIAILQIKGLGAKKVRVIWKEANITTVAQLRTACQNGSLAKMKGFGEKTQTQILENIDFLAAQTGFFRLDVALQNAYYLLENLKSLPVVEKIAFSGMLARYMPVQERVEILLSGQDRKAIFDFLDNLDGISAAKERKSLFSWHGSFDENSLPIVVNFTQAKKFDSELLFLTSTPSHLSYTNAKGENLGKIALLNPNLSQEKIYQEVGLPYIVPFLREDVGFLSPRLLDSLGDLIQENDIKGIIHAHSTYSDGAHSLREMAEACRDLGFEYLGITDHSQTAYYANGLKEHDIIRQHTEIDALNKELAPFKLFKGIESDILSDGSLDYPNEILATFDFIIASVHSNLTMSETKATERLIGAIMNPYTTILGHPTGRLLLKRDGYPIDHKAIIDACADYNVAIEINASPYRLDLDWRWVHYAMEKNVKIVIAPDSHSKEALKEFIYGVMMGKKGGLTRNLTLNALNTSELENFFQKKAQRIHNFN